MNLKIGDKVKFINEKGEGTVSKLINKTTVSVAIEDGFEIPFEISSLMLIAENTSKKKEVSLPNKIPQKINIVSEIKKSEGIHIAISLENSNNIAGSDFNFWIVNHTNYKTFFTFSIYYNLKFKTIETGFIDAFQYLLLETVNRKELDNFMTTKVDVLFFEEKEHFEKSPLTKIVKLKSVKFYKENIFTENKFIPEKALIINLSNDKKEKIELPKADLSELFFQKKSNETANKSKQNIQKSNVYEMEVDLHIEELLNDYSKMSNTEIIQYQLNYFQQVLDKAISERYRKLVVIHGVGNGRLKSGIRNLLLQNEQQNFYDASLAKYGFGATEVMIKS